MNVTSGGKNESEVETGGLLRRVQDGSVHDENDPNGQIPGQADSCGSATVDRRLVRETATGRNFAEFAFFGGILRELIEVLELQLADSIARQTKLERKRRAISAAIEAAAAKTEKTRQQLADITARYGGFDSEEADLTEKTN